MLQRYSTQQQQQAWMERVRGECVRGAGSIIGKLAALVLSGNNVENLLPS